MLVAGWYSMTLVRAIFACRWGFPSLYRGDSHLLSGPTGWLRGLGAEDMAAPASVRRLSLSRPPRELVLALVRRARDRIFRVPHAVDNELFAATASPYRIRRRAPRRAGGSASLLTPSCRCSWARWWRRSVRSMSCGPRHASAATSLCWWPAPARSRASAEAADLGVDLKQVGFMNQTELGQAYAIADCLVLPSDFPKPGGSSSTKRSRPVCRAWSATPSDAHPIGA